MPSMSLKWCTKEIDSRMFFFKKNVNHLISKRFIRFVLVGGVNTAFSYAIYSLFLLIGFNYTIANLLALVVGILFSFKTQSAFVFYNSANRLLGRFFICWSFIYLINIFFIREMLALGLNAYIAGALAIPPITVLSYVIQKFFVFRHIIVVKSASEKLK